MRKFCAAAGLVSLLLPAMAWADPPQAVTLAYDVRLREFTCWTEQPFPEPALPVDPCADKTKWNTFSPAFHLRRGQPVQVLLVNAKALDLFVIEVKDEDLAEPGLPAVGGLTELPKLQPLAAATLTIPGVGAVTASGASVSVTDLHRYLVSTDLKTFTAWLDEIEGRFDAKAVREFLALAGDVEAASTAISATTAWVTTANAIKKDDVTAITTTGSTTMMLAGIRRLVEVLDKVAWLRSEISISPVPASAATLAAASNSAASVDVADALAVPQAFFGGLNTVEGPWGAITPECWYREVAALTLSPAGELVQGTVASCPPEAGEFLKALTAAAGGTLNAAALKELQGNLNLLGERRTRLEHTASLRNELTKIQENIATGATSLKPLREALATLTTAILTKAAELNSHASALDLDDSYRLLPVGTWYATKMITVTIKQGRRAALFDAPNTTAASTVSTDDLTPPSKGPLAAVPDMGVVRTFQFPVYNVYRFQLGLGTAYSSANDRKYVVNTVTTGSGSTQVVEKYIEQTIARHYNVLWTANLVFYPKGRHAFPERARFKGEPIGSKTNDLGLMVGFSVLEPTKNMLLGGVWMPRGGSAGIQAAYHLALRDVPQGDLSAPLSSRLTTFTRRPFHGFSIGIVLSSDAFGKFLAPIFKP